MAKYGFVINATISLGIEVEANSLAEAITLAKASPVQSLCFQCAHGEAGEWSTSGELDVGDPGDCELVDVHFETTADLYPAHDEADVIRIWEGES